VVGSRVPVKPHADGQGVEPAFVAFGQRRPPRGHFAANLASPGGPIFNKTRGHELPARLRPTEWGLSGIEFLGPGVDVFAFTFG